MWDECQLYVLFKPRDTENTERGKSLHFRKAVKGLEATGGRDSAEPSNLAAFKTRAGIFLEFACPVSCILPIHPDVSTTQLCFSKATRLVHSVHGSGATATRRISGSCLVTHASLKGQPSPSRTSSSLQNIMSKNERKQEATTYANLDESKQLSTKQIGYPPSTPVSATMR